MDIKDITNYIELLAPLEYAEDFDNVGLLTGEATDTCTGVLITLDCLETVVEEAIENKCNLIVSFHPIIFNGLKHLRPTDYVRKAVIKAIKNDIAIYAIHTALDNAKNGVSYKMAETLGLKNLKTLIPQKNIIKKLSFYVPETNFINVREACFATGAGSLGNYSESSFAVSGSGTFKGNEHSNPAIGEKHIRETVPEVQLNLTFLPHQEKALLNALFNTHPYEEVAYEITTLDNSYSSLGMGAIGDLPEALDNSSFLKLLKNIYSSGVVRYSLSRKRNFQKIAVLGGSGAFAIQAALNAGADALVTADLKYHDFYGHEQLMICDVGHYESEQFTKTLLYDYLTEKFSNFAVLCTNVQTNPVNYF